MADEQQTPVDVPTLRRIAASLRDSEHECAHEYGVDHFFLLSIAADDPYPAIKLNAEWFERAADTLDQLVRREI